MPRIPDQIEYLRKQLKSPDFNPAFRSSFSSQLHWLENIQNLWDKLEDHPYDPETECILEPYIIFPEGTHREEIWQWFEKEFNISVAEDLMY